MVVLKTVDFESQILSTYAKCVEPLELSWWWHLRSNVVLNGLDSIIAHVIQD